MFHSTRAHPNESGGGGGAVCTGRRTPERGAFEWPGVMDGGAAGGSKEAPHTGTSRHACAATSGSETTLSTKRTKSGTAMCTAVPHVTTGTVFGLVLLATTTGPCSAFSAPRWPWLEGVAEVVGGGYCRLQMPLKLALGVRGTVAGHRLGALEGGGGDLPPFHCIPRGGGGGIKAE